VLDAVVKTGTKAQSSATSYPSVDEVAKAFPELEIIEVLGVGGMGVVYKARQTKLGRFVALKLLSSELAEYSVFVERFNREGRVLAQLNHPHIVNVFDFGSREDFLYLLMEFVDGVNLREAMQAGKIAAEDCLVLVQDICSALQFAHEKGVLHRDIKPENVLLDHDGRVKLADFGIAKLVSSESSEHVSLTKHGAVLGTLHYMAPEQLEAPRSIDHRADIYSLGVVFYELLTGELPLGRFPSPSDASNTDPRLDKVVLRALEKRRDRRYQTVEEVKTDVESLKPTPEDNLQAKTVDLAATIAAQGGRSKRGGWFSLATVSAILTGGSLLVGIALVLIVNAQVSLSPNGDRLALSGIAVLVALPALPAVLGAVCGLIALFDRKATHFGRSLFAVLLWPVLLVVGGLAFIAVHRGGLTGGVGVGDDTLGIFPAETFPDIDSVVKSFGPNSVDYVSSALFEVDLGNGKVELNVWQAPNVDLFKSPREGQRDLQNHRVTRLEYEQMRGQCVVDFQKRASAVLHVDPASGILGKMSGRHTQSKIGNIERQKVYTEFSSWQWERAFPIFNNAQLNEFFQRTQQAPPLEIDFDTHLAVVVVSYGTQATAPMVDQVRCEEIPAQLTMGAGTQKRIWIDFDIPTRWPDEALSIDESGRASGRFSLISFQKPDSFESLNIRFRSLVHSD
jgi:tRNA A-37 threonylcarbamoyl transferase component Bud32